MPIETSVKAAGEDTPGLKQKIEKLSAEMLGLAPGPLAELRRIEADTPATSAYWRLASQCGFLDDKADAWIQIVKIMAILTPKGQRQNDHQLHSAEQGLGAALCDGSYSRWSDGEKGSEARPFYSETRLARLLAQPKSQRAETLERIARMLAHTPARDHGVNCAQIACLLLIKDETETLRQIARDYYRRLDGARSTKNKDQKS
jgi:CRISPR system Cascade subunit CasB